MCHEVLYRFTRMPFGLRMVPSTFQWTIGILLARFEWSTVLLYFDNIIVFSNSFNDHFSYARDVVSVLLSAGITPKIGECGFCPYSVK